MAEEQAAGIRMVIEDTIVERNVIEEVLSGKSYPKPPLAAHIAVETVIDIGAHVGSAAAIWFHHVWPNARIVCYEPSAQSRAHLARNAPFATVYPEALCSDTGAATLYEGCSPCARSLFSTANETYAGQPVATLAAAAAFARHSAADVIKVDAEGAELEIMESVGAAAVYLEFHRWEDRVAIDALMRLTHILFSASIGYSVNRGELAYVRKDAIDPDVLRGYRFLNES